MITHIQTVERHSTVTGVPYPHDLKGHRAWRKTASEERWEEKKWEIAIWVFENRDLDSYRQKRRRMTEEDGHVSACLCSRGSTQKQYSLKKQEHKKRMSKKLSGDMRRELNEREEGWDQTGTDGGRQREISAATFLSQTKICCLEKTDNHLISSGSWVPALCDQKKPRKN